VRVSVPVQVTAAGASIPVERVGDTMIRFPTRKGTRYRLTAG
jgi:hypothetical protein